MQILKEQGEMKARIENLSEANNSVTIVENAARQPATATPDPPTISSDTEDGGDTFATVTSRRQKSIAKRRKSKLENRHDNSRAQNNRKEAGSQPTRKRKPPITGKKEGTSLRAVEVIRKVSVFVSRCHPEETENDILNYAKDIISDECSVYKLPTKFPTYSSFVDL